MDVIKQQKELFERKYPFRVEFVFEHIHPIILRFPSEDDYENQMRDKVPFIKGFYFGHEGKTKSTRVTKANCAYFKSLE